MSGVLALSPWTVQGHLKAIFDKTCTRTRGELWAVLTGTARDGGATGRPPTANGARGPTGAAYGTSEAGSGAP